MNSEFSQVALILLAAGESKRMGTPKQLLPYKGQSLIRHGASEAVASQCDSVIVVLGAYRDRLQPELADLPVHICPNPDWQKGMGSSISAGIKTLTVINPNIKAAIIALADQPLVTAQIYNQLIERYQNSGQTIASAYANTLGVPALFDRSLFRELLHREQDGAKSLLQTLSDRKDHLAVPQAAIDLDTPTDYQNLINS